MALRDILHNGYYSTDLCCLDDKGNAHDLLSDEPWGTVAESLLPLAALRYAYSFTITPSHDNQIEYYKPRVLGDDEIDFT